MAFKYIQSHIEDIEEHMDAWYYVMCWYCIPI